MEQFYYEYKEGDNLHKGSISAQDDHQAHQLLKQRVANDIPWSTEHDGQLIGLLMFTPESQLEHTVEHYTTSQDSPYTREDWKERLERAKDMHEGGEDIIEVEL